MSLFAEEKKTNNINYQFTQIIFKKSRLLNHTKFSNILSYLWCRYLNIHGWQEIWQSKNRWTPRLFPVSKASTLGASSGQQLWPVSWAAAFPCELRNWRNWLVHMTWSLKNYKTLATISRKCKYQLSCLLCLTRTTQRYS